MNRVCEILNINGCTRCDCGDLDASVNTVSNVSSLIKSIDSCENIVQELATAFIV